MEPTSGVIRGNTVLYVYVYYEPNDAKVTHVQAIMKCENESYVSLRFNAPQVKMPKVEFVTDSASLGEIPLNLPIKVIAVLQNFEFNEMLYEVDSASLIRGCSVDPLRGKISPRGIIILEVSCSTLVSLTCRCIKIICDCQVHLKFDVCCQFSTAIVVRIQERLQLRYTINGSVSFPRLKILPQRIDMKRVNVDTSQIHRLTATNMGTTTLQLQVLLEEYPEFRVSLSESGENSNISTFSVILLETQ